VRILARNRGAESVPERRSYRSRRSRRKRQFCSRKLGISVSPRALGVS